MERKNSLILIVLTIAIFGAFVRLYHLSKAPISLFGDELDVGYQAYSLLTTGRDYSGQFLPTYIHSLSEWRAPFQMYITVPFIKLFGLNELGVRIPVAVLGILTCMLLFLLVKNTTGKASLSLLTLFSLVIMPWHIHYSRAAFEISLLLFLILCGTYTFYKGLVKPSLLPLSLLSFLLSFYTYNTANVFVPLIIFYLLYSNWNSLGKVINLKTCLPCLVLFIIFGAPLIYQNVFGNAALRFKQNSVFDLKDSVSAIVSDRHDHTSRLSRFYHNRPLSILKKISSNYLISFSPQFLLINGDPVLRHNTPDTGQLLWLQYFLVVTGVVIASRNPKSHAFWIFWLAVSPLAASLTRDISHATRLSLMIPALAYFSGVGLNAVSRKKTYLGIAIFILAVNFLMYFDRYHNHYVNSSYLWWHEGFKQPLQYISEVQSSYQRVFINNTYEPSLIRFLFWTKFPPIEFHKQFTSDKPQDQIVSGFNGFKLDKYYFGSSSLSVNEFIQQGDLYLVSQRDEVGGDWDWRVSPPSGIKVLHTSTNPAGFPIFYVVTKI